MKHIYLKFVLFVACLVAAFTSVVAAEGLDVIAPQIGEADYAVNGDGSVDVTVRVTDDVAVDEVRLFFRSRPDDAWQFLKMPLTGEEYRVRLLPGAIHSQQLQYYIEAEDMAGNLVSSADAMNPPAFALNKRVPSAPPPSADKGWRVNWWYVAAGVAALALAGGGGGGGGGAETPTTGTLTITADTPPELSSP